MRDVNKDHRLVVARWTNVYAEDLNPSCSKGIAEAVSPAILLYTGGNLQGGTHVEASLQISREIPALLCGV